MHRLVCGINVVPILFLESSTTPAFSVMRGHTIVNKTIATDGKSLPLTDRKQKREEQPKQYRDGDAINQYNGSTENIKLCLNAFGL